MKYIIGAVAAVIIIAAAGIVFVLSGNYNIAATDAHAGVTRWLLHTTMERSVSSRAGSVKPPAQFTREQVESGFSEFNEMCVGCHGAPGKERGEIGKGLNPQPPDLAKAAPRWSSAELFWILKNGVKMTGMPAFGPTHSDERLWAIAAFVQQLVHVTPEQYAAKEQAAEKSGGDDHDHHSGEHQHQHDAN